MSANCAILCRANDFQPNARNAARHANVLLQTSLEKIRRTLRIDETRIALAYKESDQLAAAPLHVFSNGDQPEYLLRYGGRVFVSNWETGDIALLNAATKSIEHGTHLDTAAVPALRLVRDSVRLGWDPIVTFEHYSLDAAASRTQENAITA